MVMAQGQDRKEVVLVANAPPLDYSFKELRSCAELETEEPRSGTKRTAESKEANEAQADRSPSSPTSPTSPVKAGEPKMRILVRKVTTSVKLNNNMLETISGLPAALEFCLPNPLLNLQWLDISFNQLVTVEPELLRFHNLKALYMHGNCITRLAAVDRLRKMPKLLSLTMNGNPIESNKIYRVYVVGALGSLRSLDHSTITDDEASNAAAWFEGHLVRMKKRREEMALQNNDS
ncbi:unnamed protein product [Effrenium voratum]|uniref:Leucine-rich repeat-containing protein 51 n=1 Tax=Effrenium voratum TaxID=2562239 RepID=A0AA36HWF0_9DINO|nr:unnamed protein product [Effrenium voratum]